MAEPDSLLELKPGESVMFRTALHDGFGGSRIRSAFLRTSLKAGYYEYTTWMNSMKSAQ